MYTYEQQCIMNLADCYTLLYGFICQSVIRGFGTEGEAAVREGTRRFGYDRARTTREKHLKVNAKINMLNLFTLYHDLPADPRFRRELQEINQEERVSHTLVCPMADIWKEYGQMAIGRIYCEEFHPACYSHYAYDRTQVNLSRTLTQEGDTYCDFNVILRPESLPRKMRPLCFSDYDPQYRQPEFPKEEADGKKGFGTLSIKLYYHLLCSVAETLGDPGIAAVRQGLGRFAKAAAKLLLERAGRTAVDKDYVRDNFPMDLDAERDGSMWDSYGKWNARKEAEDCLLAVLKKELLGEGI